MRGRRQVILIAKIANLRKLFLIRMATFQRILEKYGVYVVPYLLIIPHIRPRPCAGAMVQMVRYCGVFGMAR
jgi:hypothetical protein